MGDGTPKHRSIKVRLVAPIVRVLKEAFVVAMETVKAASILERCILAVGEIERCFKIFG